MPKPVIIANWKMQLDINESASLAREYRTVWNAERLGDAASLVVCPSYEALSTVRDTLEGTGIALGAQDVFWQEKGAYTGELSASMLKAIGVGTVIIGHSERRKFLHEDDAMVNLKIKAALAVGLIPVLCVGETYEERTAGGSDLSLMRQVIGGLSGIALNGPDRVIVAYEPVWVIGTGQAIEPSMAEHAANVIGQALIDLYPDERIRTQIRLIYGGSVDATNIDQYVGHANIEGSLVGSASLRASSFIESIKRII